MNSLRYDLTGERFGKLLVLKRGPNMGKHGTAFICLCDCGRKELIESGRLRGVYKRAISRVACRKCLPISVGAPKGYSCGGTYHRRIHDKPLTRKQIRQYRKNLKNPKYIEVATQGAADKLGDILFGLIQRDREWEVEEVKG